MDLMIGSGHRRPLLALHERKARHLAAAFAPDRGSHHVIRTFPELLERHVAICEHELANRAQRIVMLTACFLEARDD